MHQAAFADGGVVPDAAGELHTLRDAADHDPEGYWFALLHDPRGRVPSGPGYWRTLAAKRGAVLRISCDKCPWLTQSHPVDELLQRYDGATYVSDAAHAIVHCSKVGEAMPPHLQPAAAQRMSTFTALNLAL